MAIFQQIGGSIVDEENIKDYGSTLALAFNEENVLTLYIWYNIDNEIKIIKIFRCNKPSVQQNNYDFLKRKSNAIKEFFEVQQRDFTS